jgi:tetratricopeptide (TPR) repeat protein
MWTGIEGDHPDRTASGPAPGIQGAGLVAVYRNALWRFPALLWQAAFPMFRRPFKLFLPLSVLAALGSGAGAAERSRPAAVPAAGAGFGLFLAGRLAVEERDYRAAAENLLAASRLEPDQIDLLRTAFLVALLDGRAEALPLARRLPDDLPAQLLLLGADAAAGRWDRAEHRARHLPQQGPTLALQPALIAWTLVGRSQIDQALALLRPLAEHGRFRALNALHAALIADQSGRLREAERHVRLALADQPQPTLRLALLAAGILARAGRSAEAVRLLDQLAENTDDLALAAMGPSRQAALSVRAIASPIEGIAEAYVALAAALRAEGGEESALMLTRLALRLQPQFAPALLLLGDMQAETGQAELALAAYGAIRGEDPLAPGALMRRAYVLGQAEDPEPALLLLREAPASTPQPHLRAGDLLRRRGRYAEAAEAYAAALALRGPTPRAQDWPLFYARGIARERSGNWPGAEADFLLALDLAPDEPMVLNYLGYSWADQGLNLPRARAMLERAVELRPEDGNIVDSLGWVLFRLGDIPGAVRLLERAVELEPRSATINDHLGDAYWAAGRQAEARYQWSRALGMDPEPREIEQIEVKLRDGINTPSPVDVHAVPAANQATR